jgi:eukaryotic-like serine/threonine-protein kinase
MPVTQHTTPELISPVEIAPDTYWVGKRDPGSIFHSNPYLRVFRGTRQSDGRAAQYNLLVDPGSSSDFAVVSAKVSSVLGTMGKLSGVFINHQDPDVGSSAQIISARYAPHAAILCSEATWRLIMHLNLPRERFVDTDKFPHGCRLPSGHVVVPVPSPFCHFRGAVMLYDPTSRVLFSGDLFGGLTAAGASGLWADESDWTGIRAFHQTYMPTTRAIARVIERIRKLTPAVEIIAPQHGRLLRGPLLARFLDRLSTLPVGLDVMEEDEGGVDVLTAWNSVMRRVVETAVMLLGPSALDRLSSSEVLRDNLEVDGHTVSVTSLGRWTVGTAVGLLAAGQPPAIANPIKLEAILAAEQLDLPSPDLHIDDGEGDGTAGLDPSLCSRALAPVGREPSPGCEAASGDGSVGWGGAPRRGAGAAPRSSRPGTPRFGELPGNRATHPHAIVGLPPPATPGTDLSGSNSNRKIAACAVPMAKSVG